MKIICWTCVNVERMHIFKCLPKEVLDRTDFVVHDKEQAKKIHTAFKIPINKIHISGIKQTRSSLVDQRDWAENHLLEKGEWYIGMDDNIQYMTRIGDKIYKKAESTTITDRAKWKQRCEHEFIDLCNELQAKCVEMETSYGGFEFMENPFFRQKKWKLMGYVRSKLFVKIAQHVPWRWHKDIQLMHDHAMSFKTMAKDGCIIHNRFVFVYRKQWEKGGLGSKEERMPSRISTCTRLYKEFPDFVVPGKAFDEPVCRLRGMNSMLNWRGEHGYVH